MKFRLSPILKKYTKKYAGRENDIVKMAIENFEGFEYCYKLNPKEVAIYNDANYGTEDVYLFPSLRPLDGEYALAAGIFSQLNTKMRDQYYWH